MPLRFTLPLFVVALAVHDDASLMQVPTAHSLGEPCGDGGASTSNQLTQTKKGSVNVIEENGQVEFSMTIEGIDFVDMTDITDEQQMTLDAFLNEARESFAEQLGVKESSITVMIIPSVDANDPNGIETLLEVGTTLDDASSVSLQPSVEVIALVPANELPETFLDDFDSADGNTLSANVVNALKETDGAETLVGEGTIDDASVNPNPPFQPHAPVRKCQQICNQGQRSWEGAACSSEEECTEQTCCRVPDTCMSHTTDPCHIIRHVHLEYTRDPNDPGGHPVAREIETKTEVCLNDLCKQNGVSFNFISSDLRPDFCKEDLCTMDECCNFLDPLSDEDES